ncbi:hypothetical protein PV05_04387 [Exophiala xenobiotica]|uniref:Uncharacterized protein n=1 Tax=Exophiala xenobiotica TaxID=348802 RepID=A0A0D2BT50_9EURO|nr:uncharacterized protein PV05_04387 [Exophiala xenobiotica]KIW55656.1 hypothetical protein PV05_04387 [Exophiala xenobiotica]
MDTPSPLPGSYLPANDTTFRCTTFNSSLFLPPSQDRSQSPASSSLSQTFRARTSSQSSSRKRPRLDPTSRRDTLSPPPLANTNYRIAGGLDTPTALDVHREEDADRYAFETDCRPNRYTHMQKQEKPSAQTDSYFPQTPASIESTHGNGKRRLSRSPNQNGWSKTVWALTGGIAGKVINFCWNNTFKGFHAGGGNGYNFDLVTPGVSSSSVWIEAGSKEDVFQHSYSAESRNYGDRTPVPGGFPEDQDFPSSFSAARTRSFDRRNDWVIVDDPDQDRDASPVRKKSRASTASLHARQPSRQASSQKLSRPRLASRTSASYASPRSLSVSVSSKPQHQRSVSSFDGNANASRPTSRASMASPRRQSSQVNVPQPSPEVRKFEQKLRRKEAKQDHTMNRFNAQLQAMILEGQQALGSKVEVVDDAGVDVDEDEGYGEGSGVKGCEREYSRSTVWS